MFVLEFLHFVCTGTDFRKASTENDSLVLYIDSLSRNVNEGHLREIFSKLSTYFLVPFTALLHPSGWIMIVHFKIFFLLFHCICTWRKCNLSDGWLSLVHYGPFWYVVSWVALCLPCYNLNACLVITWRSVSLSFHNDFFIKHNWSWAADWLVSWGC